MKYLVLKPLKIFGVRYKRGDFIEDAQVRSARILIGEHKITPVLNDVSSSISPAAVDLMPEDSLRESVAESAQQEVKEVKKPVRLSFAKEG